jgi:hypothetical protein
MTPPRWNACVRTIAPVAWKRGWKKPIMTSE